MILCPCKKIREVSKKQRTTKCLYKLAVGTTFETRLLVLAIFHGLIFLGKDFFAHTEIFNKSPKMSSLLITFETHVPVPAIFPGLIFLGKDVYGILTPGQCVGQFSCVSV